MPNASMRTMQNSARRKPKSPGKHCLPAPQLLRRSLYNSPGVQACVPQELEGLRLSGETHGRLTFRARVAYVAHFSTEAS